MPRMPSVLYCTDTYPPQLNGVSVVTALSVAGLRARGWDVTVIAPRYPDDLVDVFTSPSESARTDGVVTIPSVPLPGYADIRLAAPAWATVGRVLRARRPDLVHCATEFMIGRLGQRAALAAGIPAVSSYHTDFSRYTVAYGVPSLEQPVRRYLGRFHRRSRRVYTPGLPAAQELRALGVQDVEVWGRGVDVQRFHPVRRDPMLRQAYGPPNAMLFLHVGRLAAEKGVERIVAAFARATAIGASRPMRLIIAGSGPREEALRRQAPTGVTFLGNLDRETMLPQLYASADAFLFTSVTETLGLVILEAMASGLPVIATPAGGVADHLTDGVNGLAYGPLDIDAMAQAMVTLADQPQQVQMLGAGARVTAVRQSWERELDRLHESYREVIGAAAQAA